MSCQLVPGVMKESYYHHHWGSDDNTTSHHENHICTHLRANPTLLPEFTHTRPLCFMMKSWVYSHMNFTEYDGSNPQRRTMGLSEIERDIIYCSHSRIIHLTISCLAWPVRSHSGSSLCSSSSLPCCWAALIAFFKYITLSSEFLVLSGVKRLDVESCSFGRLEVKRFVSLNPLQINVKNCYLDLRDRLLRSLLGEGRYFFVILVLAGNTMSVGYHQEITVIWLICRRPFTSRGCHLSYSLSGCTWSRPRT